MEMKTMEKGNYNSTEGKIGNCLKITREERRTVEKKTMERRNYDGQKMRNLKIFEGEKTERGTGGKENKGERGNHDGSEIRN